MKQILMMILVLGLAAPAMAAEAQKCAAPKLVSSVASVDGMVCDFCTQSITKALKKNPEVGDVAVDLTAKTVTVTPVAGKIVTDDMVGKAIDYAGYKLVKIEQACKG